MAEVPLQAVALPASITFSTVALATKPDAPLHCTHVAATPDGPYADVLVVFLNGLLAPQTAWLPAIALLLRRLAPHRPQILAYDRFGQGKTTARDPLDAGREPHHGHDALDAAHDLHQLITQVTAAAARPPPRLVLAANSLGCAIARLYAHAHPGAVAGLLFFDSIMAASDFVGVFPDPDAAGFDAAALPAGVTPALLRETRAQFAARFHPSLPNPEGISRRNLAALLPRADEPVLVGPGAKGPLVTVVGHDWDTFAQEALTGGMGTPVVMSMEYMNPTWWAYNEGLARLTSPERCKGPLVAKGCGHFVQRDDPAFVAAEVAEMLERLASGE